MSRRVWILACILVLLLGFAAHAEPGKPHPAHPTVPGSRAPEAPGQVRLEVTAVPASVEAVPAPAVGWPCLIFAARQGGSEYDWSVPGTDNFAPATARMQIGVVKGAPPVPMPDGTYLPSQFNVTFPEPFQAVPWCMVTSDQGAVLRWTATPTMLTIETSTDNLVHWIAIGP